MKRFDNFQYLWTKFEEVFKACGVNKEAAKSVFEVNFGTFKKHSEGDVPYIGEAITYIDTASTKEYIAFHEGPVYILPAHDASLQDGDTKAVAFSSRTASTNKSIIVMKVEKGRLILEEYIPELDMLEVQLYDEQVVEMLHDKGFSYGNISNIKSSLDAMQILPDKSVRICEGWMSVRDGGTISPTRAIDISPLQMFYNQAMWFVNEELAKSNGRQM